MKVLVLGAGGMAGSMVTKYLQKQNHEIIPWFRSNFDALKDEVPNLTQYDFVINCIGLIKQKSNDDKLLFALNADLPHKLANKCKKLIHISSDCVFSGNLPIERSYTVLDKPDAQDSYGKSKAQGEACRSTMILRTSIIGPAKDNNGLFEWFRTAKQDLINGFRNHWWSGITTLELAKTIDYIIKNDIYKYGIFNIASDKVNKYILLSLINDIFNLSKVIVPHNDVQIINRALSPVFKSKNITEQLYELQKWIE
jgi:dTDP-4-dehydrorhamnose reductase